MAKEIKRLTEFGKECLQVARIEWNRMTLTRQMGRKDYTELMKVIELLWWKWNRKEKCHIFDTENLQEAIDEVCDTMEVVDIKVLYQQYYTPSELAKRLVEIADIQKTDDVLEPSAWQGAIVKEILKKNYDWIVLIEIDVDNIKTLKEEFNCYEWIKDDCDWQGTLSKDKSMNIFQWDFLDNRLNENQFQKIVMNPPFTKSQDVKHILKAYKNLCEWWRLVSIASSSIQTREWKLYDELRELNPEFIEIEDLAFKESGTMVNSVIVVINK